jgi:flagellar FliL protein
MSDHAPAAAAPAEGEAPAAGGSKALLPVIAALVVGLAVGAGTGAVVVGPMAVKKMGIEAKAVPPKAAAHGDEEGGDAEGHGEEAPAEGGHGEAKEGAATAVKVVNLENLVLNPASSGGSRYLLMSITIECSDDKSVADLTARDAELKDLILTTLSKKTVDELSDVSLRDGLKTELTTSLKERFGKKSVKQLYFPQFVIQ